MQFKARSCWAVDTLARLYGMLVDERICLTRWCYLLGASSAGIAANLCSVAVAEAGVVSGLARVKLCLDCAHAGIKDAGFGLAYAFVWSVKHVQLSGTA